MGDSILSRYAALNQQARGNQTCTTQASLAVNKYTSASIEGGMQGSTGFAPLMLPFPRRRGDIFDRQVKPLHPSSSDFISDSLDTQGAELISRDQRKHHTRAPAPDNIEVETEVPKP